MHPATEGLNRCKGIERAKEGGLTRISFGDEEEDDTLLGGKRRDVDVLALLVLERKGRKAVANINRSELSGL